MTKDKTPAEPVDKRVGFDVPDEVAPDFKAMAKKIGVSNAGLAAFAVAVVIPKIKNGELVRLNDRLVPAKNGVPIPQPV